MLPARTFPDVLQGYLVPVTGVSTFAFFPWTALVFAGATVGVLLDAARTPEDEARMNARVAAGGAGCS